MKLLMILAQIFCGVMLLPWFVVTVYAGLADKSKMSSDTLLFSVIAWVYPVVFLVGAVMAWRSYKRGDAAITLAATIIPVLWALPLLWISIKSM